MKRLILVIVLCLIPMKVYAMPTEESLEQQIQDRQFSRALDMVKEADFPSFWKGEAEQSFLQSIAGQKQTFLSLCAGLLLYAMLCALASNHKSVCFMGRLVLSLSCIEHVTAEISVAGCAVKEMAGLVQVLLPSLCVLTAASGGGFRATSVHMTGLFCAETAVAIITGWVIPLVVFAFAVQMLRGVCDEISTAGVARLFLSVGKWLLGIVLSLSVGMLTLCGFASGVQDSMTMKTAKFLTSSLVPVAGAALSQAAESVAASAGLLKGTVGTAGLIAVVLYFIAPMVRLLVVMFLYRILSAVAEVLCGVGAPSVFSAAADTFSLLVGCVATVGVMSFLIIAVLLGGIG